MTAYLCPVFQEPQFTDNDEFLAGGLLWFYEAGSSTLATAYTDEAGSVAWSNPIVLNSRGESGGTIWLTGGTQYRIVLENKPIYGQTHGAVITDHDYISGINDPSVFSSDANWILFAGTPTYVSATSFTVAGDQRDIFAEHRRVYTINSGGTVYSSVDTAVFGSGLTTVTIINDSGVLDVGLSAVYYSSIAPIALPNSYDELTATDLDATNLTSVATINTTAIADFWTDANNTFVPNADPLATYFIFANNLRFYKEMMTVTVPSGSVSGAIVTESFSSPFPTACLQVIACWGDFLQHYTDEKFHVNSFNANGVTFRFFYTGTPVADIDYKIRILAIGY